MNLIYLITGVPRSATQFMAKFLTSAGLPTHHEIIFGMPGSGIYSPGAKAEASWMSAPYLSSPFLKKTKIIQITRDPVKVVSSLIARRFLEEDRPSYIGFFSSFVRAYEPELFSFDGIDRYLSFWIGWNNKIEPHADVRVKIEKINEQPQKFLNFLKLNPEGKNLHLKKDTNHSLDYKEIPKETLETADLIEGFRKKAKQYGYEI